MDRDSLDQHLSQITTAWTVLDQAHGRQKPGAEEPDPQQRQAQAQALLIRRYGAAIYRYLLGALRDEDSADELFQEFALRFVRGDFHRADQSRGRFRDFLKTALFRLIVDAQRRRKRASQSRPLPEGLSADEALVDSGATPLGDEADRQFLAIWRGELLARAWDVLKDHERQTGQPLHTVLKLRGDQPDLRSADLAETLSQQLGRPVTAGWVRKKLLQARERYTDALLDAVAHSLAEPSRENLEQELIDLELLAQCREALDRRSWPTSPG